MDFIKFIQDESVKKWIAGEIEAPLDRIEVISDALGKQLSPREQKMLGMRFGLTDGTKHTLEEVGKEFGVTRERIRQIEAKAFEKIREYLKTH